MTDKIDANEVLNAASSNDSPSGVSLKLNLLPQVNFAVQYAQAPVFQSLVVVNDTDSTLRGIRIDIEASPAFVAPFSLLVDRVDPRGSVFIEKFDEQLDPSFLAQNAERTRGAVLLKLYAREGNADAETLLARDSFPIDVLAHNEWQGVNVLPSLLAAYVTPDLESVARLLASAGERLREQGYSPALDGYRSRDPQRVAAAIRSIFEVVRAQQIRLADPSEAFDPQGGRVRFVDEILAEKKASRLDISLLFASLLEGAGLHPLIALHQTRIYVGCRLLEEVFPDAFTDDFQALRNRAEDQNLLLFEPSLALGGNTCAFADAAAAAEKYLSLSEQDFVGVLDVKRARLEDVRPLPIDKDDQAPEEQPLPLAPDEAEETPAASRADRWKQKLLDLTLRNRFLNYREDKKTLRFLLPEDLVPKLEDVLVDGKSFQIAPLESAEAKPSPIRTAAAAETLMRREEELRHDFETRILHPRPEIALEEMNKRLNEISKQARKFLQESGVNALYLTLGTLVRPDAKDAAVKRYAPLLLLPIRLAGSPNKNVYSIKRTDDDAMLNATLFELMRRDYGKEFQGLDPNDLPTDEHGVDVPKIFEIVRQEIQNLQGWELRQDASISLFSFQKFIMWSDLNEHYDDIASSPIVRHLIETPELAYVDGIREVKPEALDAEYPYNKIVTPLSADSSQLAATLAAANGKSFVLQGPPGTGKSQTIANIIALSLYNNKKVLFVAEKRAALEVVYNRLCGLGLGPFCLELHSNKSGKQQILDQLEESLNVLEQSRPANWDDTTNKLEELKTQLNAYVEELHRVYPCGSSLYETLSWLEAHDDLREKVPEYEREGVLALSKQELESELDLAKELQHAAQNVPPEAWDDLRPFGVFTWSPKFAAAVGEKANVLIAAVDATSSAYNAFAKRLGFSEIETETEIARLRRLVEASAEAKLDLPETFYNAEWAAIAPKYRRFIELARSLDADYAKLRAAGMEKALKDAFDLYEDQAFNADEDVPINDAPLGASELCVQACAARKTVVRFILAAKKLYAELRLHWDNSGRHISKAGALAAALAEHKTPSALLLQRDWPVFSSNARKLDRAYRDIVECQEEVGVYADDCGVLTEFSNDSERIIPQGAFAFTDKYRDASPPQNTSALEGSLSAAATSLNALRDAAKEVFNALDLNDPITESTLTTNQRLFKNLTALPPKSDRFLADGWFDVEPALAQALESAKAYAYLHTAYSQCNLDLLNGVDLASGDISSLPDNIYALRSLCGSVSSTFDSFSLVDLQSDRQPIPSKELNELLDLLDKLYNATSQFLERLRVDPKVDERKTSAALRLVDALRGLPTPAETFFAKSRNEAANALRETLANAKIERELLNELSAFNVDALSSYNAAAGREQYRNAEKAFFLFRGAKKKKVVKPLQELRVDGSAELSFESLPELFDKIDALQTSRRRIEELKGIVKSAVPDVYADDGLSLDLLERYIALGERLAEAADVIGEGAADEFCANFGAFMKNKARSISPENLFYNGFEALVESYHNNAPKLLSAALEIRTRRVKLREEYEYGEILCSERFGGDWQGLDSDWDALRGYLDAGREFAALAQELAPDRRGAETFMRWIARQWTRENLDAKLRAPLDAFNASWERYTQLTQEVAPSLRQWSARYDAARKTITAYEAETLARFERGSFDGYDLLADLDAGDKIVRLIDELRLPVSSYDRFYATIAAAWAGLNDSNSTFAPILNEFAASRAEFDRRLPELLTALRSYDFPLSADAETSTPAPCEKIDAAVLTAAVERCAKTLEDYEALREELPLVSTFAVDGKFSPNLLESILDRLADVDALAASDSEREALGRLFANAGFPDRYAELTRVSAELFERCEEMRAETGLLKTAAAYDSALSSVPESEVFADARELAERVVRNLDHFSAWQNWLKCSAAAKRVYPRFVDAIFARQLAPELAADGVKYRLYEEIANAIVSDSQLLQNALSQSDLQDRNISKFKRLDAQYSEAAKRLVLYRLARNLPKLRAASADNIPRSSELGRLKHEINAKKHTRSIRQILADIPTLLRQLKPCLLTSPLSVAQYLPPDGERFDIVVFDEASQIPVWDAVGAIARGAQLIVVGDSKQLPPTNFFQRGNDEEEDPGEIADAESILQECSSARLPEIMLQWHYRSRREALIAFSNNAYYNGRLKTFPSADRANTGVRFEYVADGVYDRGGSKTNVNEAKRLVEDVVARLRDPESAKHSIGVVTFNEAQKDLIEDLLDEQRRKFPELEPFFDPERPDHLFVKNLENVQGDERDIIYFSICYGKTRSGKLSVNFGPLNKIGGERRLNVAITRAKEENVVFSSIHAEEIDLSRHSGSAKREKSRGVQDLKRFLDFAERGGRDLTSAAETDAQDAALTPEVQGIVESAANFLRENGYDVRLNIGFSKTRVDAAVVDPSRNDRYILGIECDGAAYRDHATARDRDVLRRQVLEGLGWRIARVWAPAWRFAPEKARRQLLDDVAQAIEAANRRPEPAATSNTPAPSPLAQAAELSHTLEDAPAPTHAGVPLYPDLGYLEELRRDMTAVHPNELASVMAEQAAIIVQTEGPILAKLLEKRMKDVGNVRRADAAWIRALKQTLQNARVKHTLEPSGAYLYWPQNAIPEEYCGYRVPRNQEDKREISEIPLCELENAAKELERNYGRFPDFDELCRQIVKLFGYQRVAPTMKDRLAGLRR